MDEAISQYKKALEIDSGYAEAHNDLANALLAKGKADEAISEYHVALEIKPNYAEAKYNLGIALRQKERADKTGSHAQ